jgi:hypothetical protein
MYDNCDLILIQNYAYNCVIVYYKIGNDQTEAMTVSVIADFSISDKCKVNPYQFVQWYLNCTNIFQAAPPSKKVKREASVESESEPDIIVLSDDDDEHGPSSTTADSGRATTSTLNGSGENSLIENPLTVDRHICICIKLNQYNFYFFRSSGWRKSSFSIPAFGPEFNSVKKQWSVIRICGTFHSVASHLI